MDYIRPSACGNERVRFTGETVNLNGRTWHNFEILTSPVKARVGTTKQSTLSEADVAGGKGATFRWQVAPDQPEVPQATAKGAELSIEDLL